MSCPNCNQTMHHVNDGVPSTFWCPNCGTLKTDEPFSVESTPTIVSRATELYKQVKDVVVGDRQAEPALRALGESLPRNNVKEFIAWGQKTLPRRTFATIEGNERLEDIKKKLYEEIEHPNRKNK